MLSAHVLAGRTKACPVANDAAGADEVDLFASLLEAHRDKLYRVAFRMTGHAEDAQDLLQDALLEAYKCFGKFQRGTFFDKWLYRIMTNTFIDRQRKKKRTGRTESLDAPLGMGEDGEGAARDVADWNSDPARVALRGEYGEDVQSALNALPPEFRMTLILSDVEEFSYEEVALLMGTPVGTVRSRLHRARAQMKQSLSR